MEIFKSTDQFDMNTFNTKLGGALTELVPSGIIAMWSGTVDAIPKGWVLCDGTNNTPNLRNRFIVGAGDEYNVGDVGGVKSYTFEGYSRIISGSISGQFYPKTGSDASWTMDNRPPYYALCYIMKQ